MKKLFLIMFIVMLLTVSAIVAYAQAVANDSTVLRLPLVFTQHNSAQVVDEDFCGAVPEVFELTDSQGNPVGQLSVSNNRQNIFVTYMLSGDYCLAATDLEVATSLAEVPQENGSPLPDQFEFRSQQSQCLQHRVYVVPFTDPRKLADKLYLPAHASFTNAQSGAPGEAWTTCYPFPAEDGTGYCTYAPKILQGKPFSLAVGYEDLMMVDSIDFDYNDWLTDLNGTLNYCRTSTEHVGLYSLEFNIAPEARGAGLDHSFHLSFDANTFPSDGVSTLTIWDQDGNVVDGHTDLPFLAAAENDFTLIPLTSQAFPGILVNTIEDRPFVPTQRTARLTIVFDEILPFNSDPSDPTLPENVHGANLLFDPYLFVLRTSIPSYAIHKGDVRMLILPSSALSWSEERIPVWSSYPDVIPGDLSVTPKVPPIFPGSWWLNSNECVYNGVPCAVPPVEALDIVTTPIASPGP